MAKPGNAAHDASALLLGLLFLISTAIFSTSAAADETAVALPGEAAAAAPEREDAYLPVWPVETTLPAAYPASGPASRFTGQLAPYKSCQPCLCCKPRDRSSCKTMSCCFNITCGVPHQTCKKYPKACGCDGCP